MTKALQALVKTHYASLHRQTPPPSKDTLNVIVQSSNGDIRSAIMALQFACVVEMGSKKKGNQSARVVLESVTRREQSLALFHLMGKVLYNKRWCFPFLLEKPFFTWFRQRRSTTPFCVS